MSDNNKLDEMFNNKNRHEEFERENYAEIIEDNMNCKENENLINTFATMFAINSLKNIKPIYQVAYCFASLFADNTTLAIVVLLDFK